MTSPALHDTARVATDRPDRYRKQLGSHLGRRIELAEADTVSTLTFDRGTATLTEADGALVLDAVAPDQAALDRIRDVVGGHLERFGERDGLVVTWGADAG